MNHLSLFTGIGGIDLAAECAGFHTSGQCEMDEYCIKVLEKNFGEDIPRWRDIRYVTNESFFEKSGERQLALLSGGFPCQPFSCAGKRKGTEDDRYLWPEMLRVVRELRPRWVLGENVAGIVNMELGSVLSDLEGEGYTVRSFLIPACGVGAWHRRERIFIVANAECKPIIEPVGVCKIPTIQRGNTGIGNESWKLFELVTEHVAPSKWRIGGSGSDTRPLLVRNDDGVSNRVDRLRALGNAVVPQQVYPILKAIADIESGMVECQ